MFQKDSLTFDDVLAEERAVLRGNPPDADGESRVVDADPGLSALCISGGGIRSATFALGCIQALAEQGVLANFDYLSTVSGGGYIGAWLTCWKERAGGIDNIIPKLSPNGPRPKKGELDPIGHLREYNNYLSPKLGFFSADTWTLVATVTRNMMLNWLVFVPLLLFVLMAPRLILSLARLGETFEEYYGSGAAHFLAGASNIIPILSGALFAIAIFNTMRYLPAVGHKDHTQADFLKYCLGPLIAAALAFVTYDSWFYSEDAAAAGHTTVLPNFGELVLWITGSCSAGWTAYILLCVQGVRKRLSLIAGPLSLAILLTGVSTATAAWLLSASIYPATSWPSYIVVGPPLLLLAFMAAGSIYVGLTSRVLEDDDREWMSRGAAWMLLFVVSWVVICGLVLLAPSWALALGAWARTSVAAAGGFAGWISAAGGYSAKTKSDKNSKDPTTKKSTLVNWAAKLAAPLFVVVFIVALSMFTTWMLSITGLTPNQWDQHERVTTGTRAEVVVGLAIAFLAFAWFAARYININTFSLHALYRSRLIRAYLGASNDRSKANKFIGFAETDNIPMYKLTPQLKPFHIVNVTLNLVAGDRLAWQQRKAESFTVSPLHCGSSFLGYRRSCEYGGRDGISLGTAITISGAAASPNMGYHSSSIIGFIMTLFNARLGAWLGNPGSAGARTWRLSGPSSAVGSLVKEAFGLTNDRSAYVYLSDGGHFENLGIYEMVMRGCRRIVVFDSACDPTFIYEDLGNALRKIRIDLGIPIDFDDAFLNPLRKREKRCAFATIRYSAVDPSRNDGYLIYVKPMMLGNEPPDVSTYHASHTDFPHQSTGNQWYDESQTESYRMLGLFTMSEIAAGWSRAGGLAGFFAHVRDGYLCGTRVISTTATSARAGA